MIGRQLVTMEIVSEACCHIYMPQLALLYGRCRSFGIIIMMMITFVGCTAVYQALSHINLFNPDSSPAGLEWFYSFWFIYSQSPSTTWIIIIICHVTDEGSALPKVTHLSETRYWVRVISPQVPPECPCVTLDVSHRVSKVHFFIHATGRLPFWDFCQD